MNDATIAFVNAHYEVMEWRHATAILESDFPDEYGDVLGVLSAFRLKRSEILKPGGRKSGIANEIDSALTSRGWRERAFATKIVIDTKELESPTHKVDCFKNCVGLEIEWNNKDPFYDRDLNNFRLLFELRALDVGIIVTRSDELQSIFDALGRGDSYGASTTHMSKLLPRLEGGSGGGCPILVFGITNKLYVED
jgi:Restriction endonuclease BglII